MVPLLSVAMGIGVFVNILSCVLVTNNMGSGLDERVYFLYIPQVITHL
jgi:hypothetical protein